MASPYDVPDSLFLHADIENNTAKIQFTYITDEKTERYKQLWPRCIIDRGKYSRRITSIMLTGSVPSDVPDTFNEIIQQYTKNNTQPHVALHCNVLQQIIQKYATEILSYFALALK